MIRFTALMFIFVREIRDCSKTDTSTEKFIFPSVFSVKSIFSYFRNNKWTLSVSKLVRGWTKGFRKKLENDLAPDSSAEIPPESYTQIAYLPIRNSLIMRNKPIKATA